jgi:serine palmitoyltransferase
MSLLVELAGKVEPFTPEFLTSLDIPRATFYQIVLDTVLLTFAVYVLMRKPDKPEKPLTESEINQLIEEWEPEPLFKQIDERRLALGRKVPTITGSTSTHVTINNKSVLTFARTNFLGMITNPKVEEAANKALYKYGTGSCGPRGFYGTIDVHLELEQRIKKFMDSEDCLIYAYGFATVSSAIPAFAGRGDLLIVDKGVSYAVQTGIKLSRSEVIWFEHNDAQDLERILQKVQEQDKRKKRKLNRRFIVIEGVYPNYGDLAPLPKIVELKEKYKYRLVMDDSFGVGAIGKTGRGTCEFYNIPVKQIEILTGGLESTVSSVGGFCCGSRGIIFHQRLNASGYVFSASLPPLLTTAAHAAFDVIDENPQLITKLAANAKLLVDGLKGIKGMKTKCSSNSPIINLELVSSPKDRMDEEEILQSIVDKALENGVLISRAIYILDQERFPPPASIRIYASAAHSEAHIKQAVDVIKAAAASVL